MHTSRTTRKRMNSVAGTVGGGVSMALGNVIIGLDDGGCCTVTRDGKTMQVVPLDDDHAIAFFTRSVGAANLGSGHSIVFERIICKWHSGRLTLASGGAFLAAVRFAPVLARALVVANASPDFHPKLVAHQPANE